MSLSFVSPKEAVMTPFRRIYLVWGLILGLGFYLTSQGVGLGYTHWIPLVILGLVVQATSAPLSDTQQRGWLIKWAVILVVGMVLTHLMLNVVIPFPKGMTSFAGPWLFLLGLGQFFTGRASQQRIEKAVGLLWIVLAIVFWSPTWTDQVTYGAVALLTAVPYLFIALRRG